MGKTVKEIEDRLLDRIAAHVDAVFGNNRSKEDAIIGYIRQKDVTIHRQAGQIAELQRMLDNKPQTIVNESSAKSLWLVSVDQDQVISAIKLVRELTSLGLKEAKDFVDKARGMFLENPFGLDRKYPPAAPQKLDIRLRDGEQILSIKRRFAEIGATVEYC